MGRKLIIALALVGLLVFFKLAGLDQYFTLAYIKESRELFADLYADHRVGVLCAYGIIYIVSTALSMPGATVLTLAGGAMFGLTVGVILVSFASTIGATLACFVSRYIFRDWVHAKFGDKLTVINEGIRREGGFYLFSLRLVPLFPFFVINLVMGVTEMRLSTFYWISQLGMLPATIVYVNAGKELGRLTTESSILSPGLIVSFAVLGLFPLTVKKLLAWYKRRGEVDA